MVNGAGTEGAAGFSQPLAVAAATARHTLAASRAARSDHFMKGLQEH